MSLAPGGVMALGYQVGVPSDGLLQSRLDAWSSDLTKAEAVERSVKPVITRIASISIAPSSVTLQAGDTGKRCAVALRR